MKETAVARRYAKAIVEKYPDPKTLEAVGKDLNAFSDLFEQTRFLKMTILNPAMPLEGKEAILEEISSKMGVSDPTKKALALILAKGRMGIIRFIAVEYERISFLALGKVRATVTSAMELSAEEKDSLQKSLSALSGKEAVMEIKVDPELIGGVVARIGSVVYDGSVANQLRGLKVRLN